MAHLFSLHPWDVDRLTITEFELYAHEVDETRKAARHAEKGLR